MNTYICAEGCVLKINCT